MSEQNQYNPTMVSPPGSTLADMLEMKGLTYKELAARMNLNEVVLYNIVQGTAPIMPVVAMSLAEHIGGTAQFWMRREEQYRKWLATQIEEEESEFTDLLDRFVIVLEVRGRKDYDNYRRIGKFLDHGTFQDGLADAGVEVKSVVISFDTTAPMIREIPTPRCALEPHRKECDDDCPGWCWDSYGLLEPEERNVLQRCDTCRLFESDEAALEHVRQCDACQRILGAHAAAVLAQRAKDEAELKET